MNVHCNAGCLPRDLIYQGEASGVKAISSGDAATQWMNQWGCNVQGAAICIHILSTIHRKGRLRSNKWVGHLQQQQQGGWREMERIQSAEKCCFISLWVWGEYFIIWYWDDLRSDDMDQSMLNPNSPFFCFLFPFVVINAITEEALSNWISYLKMWLVTLEKVPFQIIFLHFYSHPRHSRCRLASIH